MTQKYITHSQAETEALGEEISKHIGPGDVVVFYGELGAGKTAFSRGVLRGLGYTGDVTSPTFTIVNEYRGNVVEAAHFDMYRIDSDDALYSTGYYDYLDGKLVVLIEWGQNIEWALENDIIKIDISGSGDSERTITVEGLEL